MIKLNSTALKSAIAKVEKGLGRNVLLPITGMIGVKVKSNSLIFYSTDGTNDVTCTIPNATTDPDASVTVKADTLVKLMSKVTSETITFDIHESSLEINANGKYEIPLEVDEEGLVDFPEIKFDFDNATECQVNLTTIANVLAVNKSAAAIDYVTPELTGYYVGKDIVTGDGEQVCYNSINFSTANSEESPMLLNPKFVYLARLFTEEKIQLYRHNGKVCLKTESMTLCGTELAGIENYPIESIYNLKDLKFSSCCELPKHLTLEVLDRLEIFMDAFDENGGQFMFTETGLNISSKQNNSIETINYTSSSDYSSFACILHIPRLKELIKSMPGDVIKLHYGNDTAIKLTTEKVTKILALMEETGVE